MTPLVFIAAALAGLAIGTLGGGGAILTVPALVYLAGQGAHDATAGSLVIVGVAALVGLIPHARRGQVRVRSGLVVGALGAAGAVIGSRLGQRVEPELLLTGFGALLLIVGALMLHRAVKRPSDRPEPETDPGPRTVRLVVAATIAGLLTGFFGVGGGFILVPMLALALGFPMPAAVGTSLLIIALNSAAGLLGRSGQLLDLDWSLIAVFTAVTMIASLLGARLSTRLSARTLGIAFAVLLLGIGVFMAIENLPHLV